MPVAPSSEQIAYHEIYDAVIEILSDDSYEVHPPKIVDIMKAVLQYNAVNQDIVMVGVSYLAIVMEKFPELTEEVINCGIMGAVTSVLDSHQHFILQGQCLAILLHLMGFVDEGSNLLDSLSDIRVSPILGSMLTGIENEQFQLICTAFLYEAFDYLEFNESCYNLITLYRQYRLGLCGAWPKIDEITTRIAFVILAFADRESSFCDLCLSEGLFTCMMQDLDLINDNIYFLTLNSMLFSKMKSSQSTWGSEVLRDFMIFLLRGIECHSFDPKVSQEALQSIAMIMERKADPAIFTPVLNKMLLSTLHMILKMFKEDASITSLAIKIFSDMDSLREWP